MLTANLVCLGKNIALKEETKEFIQRYLNKWNITNLKFVNFKSKKTTDTNILCQDESKRFGIYCYIPIFDKDLEIKFLKGGGKDEPINQTYTKTFPITEMPPEFDNLDTRYVRPSYVSIFQGKLTDVSEFGGQLIATYSLYKLNPIWSKLKLNDLDETSIYIFGKGMYEFLVKTKQISGYLNRVAIDTFAVNIVQEYRNYFCDMRRDIRLSANRRKRFLREIRSISTSGKSKKVNKRKILVKIAYCKKCDKPLKGIPTMPLSGIRIIKVLAKELCNKCARTKKKINLVKIGNKIVKSKPAGIINEKTDIERILDLAWQSGEKIRRKISKGSIIRKKQ